MSKKNDCKCNSCKCEREKHTREVKKIKVDAPIVFDVPLEYNKLPDPLVTRVVARILKRSDQGMKDYGVSMEDNDTKTIEEWIDDAQEELMDAVIYLEKVKGMVKNLDIK